MKSAFVQTPLGTAQIIGSSEGITSFKVLEKNEFTSQIVPDELQDAIFQIQKYFEGNLKDFNLNLTPDGTEFQQKVWWELRKIPFGKTISYMELSKRLGDPKTIRAAASANGKNPLWILIPCHRVIGSDGSLTGYAGGLWRKKWLLEHESSSKQLSLL
ncbi:MAG TPA: methylated-DNA--[protein]-cysteine S-methyltransferase [Salinimicrobium sp.]|nr:methylated-DNA--[protein]-cysteine S-methyltransferase [Salinimicrobium sp.]